MAEQPQSETSTTESTKAKRAADQSSKRKQRQPQRGSRLAIRLSDAEANQLRSLTVTRGVTVSGFVRALLLDYLAGNRRSASPDPTDLAAQPWHAPRDMELRDLLGALHSKRELLATENLREDGWAVLAKSEVEALRWALDKSIQQIDNMSPEPPPSEEIMNYAMQLQKIGVNVNQIALAANGGLADPSLGDPTEAYKSELSRLRKIGGAS